MGVVLARGLRGLVLIIFAALGALPGGCAAPPVGPGAVVLLKPEELGLADGQIISVNRAAREAYITLAAKDHVRTGIRFSCYDARVGVQNGGWIGELEVMEVGQEYSRCRITAINSQRPLEGGDLIANGGYRNAKDRKIRFAIRGNVDLDGDGVATEAERQRLLAMIARCGGEVDERPSPLTDYVILGARPADPVHAIPLVDPSMAATGGIMNQRQEDQKSFDQAVEFARTWGIQTLNTNRLFALLGADNIALARNK